MTHVFMYTQTYCPFCERAKTLLESKSVDWEEVNLDAQPGRRAEMVERSGQTTVPQIWIADVHVGGCDELMALEARGELDSMLAK
jgi:glutaredoxin 3